MSRACSRARVLEILRLNGDLLRDGAQRLLTKETLDAADLRPLFARLHPVGGADDGPQAAVV